MILSDVTIEKLVAAGKILILPSFDKKDIRPTGIRLHLAEEILVPGEGQTVDIEDPVEIKYERIVMPAAGYIVKPGCFLLASTVECIKTPRNIVCHLEGRSTIARLGLSIHCTSGMIDCNYEEPRSIVLEMKNNSVINIVLKPKLAVAMLTFSKLTTRIRQKTQSQYRNQKAVETPNLFYNPGEKEGEEEDGRTK